MAFYDVEQNTDAWLDLRAEKITGSSIKDIMANFGKAFGEPAKRYAVNIATERLRGERIKGDRYANKHMESGHIEEPIARELYQHRTGRVITNGGFFDNGNTGCSPDGCILFEDGGIEIKSVIPTTHFETDKRRAFDPAYKWQLMFNLKETGWEFIDYISYCEQYYRPKQLIVIPVYAKDHQQEFDMIDKRIEEFENLVTSCSDIMQEEWNKEDKQ